MLIERESDLSLECQARAFEDDLGGEFGHAPIISPDKFSNELLMWF